MFLKSLEVGLLEVDEEEDALAEAPVDALLALLGLLLRWLRLCASRDATVFFFGIDTPRPNRLDCNNNNNNNSININNNINSNWIQFAIRIEPRILQNLRVTTEHFDFGQLLRILLAGG